MSSSHRCQIGHCNLRRRELDHVEAEVVVLETSWNAWMGGPPGTRTCVAESDLQCTLPVPHFLRHSKLLGSVLQRRQHLAVADVAWRCVWGELLSLSDEAHSYSMVTALANAQGTQARFA